MIDKRLIFLTLLLFLFAGCFAKYKLAIPLYEEKPILFGLYSINAGYSENKNYHDNFYYWCTPEFLTPNSDTSSIDTLPVLVFDSISFEADCLPQRINYQPITLRNIYEDTSVIKRQLTLLKDDLFFKFYEKVEPIGCYLPCGYDLPKSCQNSIVKSIVYASMYNRTTNELKAIDSAKIYLRFDTKTKWYRSLGTSDPLCDSIK